MLKGFLPLDSNMLGDAAPLIFPIWLIFLTGWLFPAKIESYAKKHSPVVSKIITNSYRFGPLFIVGIMIGDRIRSLINRDTTYLEVAQRLGPGDFQFSDLRLLFTGDGVAESILFLLLVFALISHRLPSISKSPIAIRKQVQHRIMAYISFCTLVSFWICFPESSYYSPENLPLQTTHSAQGDYSLPIVLLTGALILVSSELFAITTIPFSDDGLTTLSKRSKLKMYVILPILILLMSRSTQSSDSWWLNLSQGGMYAMVLFFISNAVGLVLITVPSKSLDSHLQHGEDRTKGLLVQFILSIILVFIITSIYLSSTEPFDVGNGYLLQSSWLTIGILVFMVIGLILPNFGFDGATRPELWWLRLALIFTPSILFTFSPFAIFLLPACWYLLAISIVMPWIVEKDVASPPLLMVILPLIVSMIVVTYFSLSTDWPLMAFITIGWIPSIFSSVGIRMHIREMKSQESA
jgi:hypothetical protein